MWLKDTGNLVWKFTKEVFREWGSDRAWQLSAALSFYTIFSMTPLLIIALAVTGMFFSEMEAREELVEQVRELAGQQGSEVIQQILDQIARPQATLTASIVGFVVLIVGASGIFWQLRIALNSIWGIRGHAKSTKHSIFFTIKARLFTLGLAIGSGFILLFSLIISATLATVERYFNTLFPDTLFIWQFVNILFSYVVLTLLFSVIFKFVSDAKVRWSQVWTGALFTTILFNIGKYLIGIYLSQTTVDSAYGAAGSFVIFLVWIYYSAQILLLGAEFTQVYSRHIGTPIETRLSKSK